MSVSNCLSKRKSQHTRCSNFNLQPRGLCVCRLLSSDSKTLCFPCPVTQTSGIDRSGHFLRPLSLTPAPAGVFFFQPASGPLSPSKTLRSNPPPPPPHPLTPSLPPDWPEHWCQAGTKTDSRRGITSTAPAPQPAPRPGWGWWGGGFGLKWGMGLIDAKSNFKHLHFHFGRQTESRARTSGNTAVAP